jgi:hypothetical protein
MSTQLLSADLEASNQTTLKLIIVGFGLILITKLYLASVLDLYSDEIFYWQASTHPALAYSDLPFITATLTSIGSLIAPASAFAVRTSFLVLGSALPFLIFWIGKPITGSRRALEAAGLSLCLPLGASLGMLAVPDVPIIFFGLLAIGLFERALRIGKMKYWIAVGCIAALGFSTHYRFFLYPAAAVLFLITCKEYHKLWKAPGLWVAILISLLGLIPIVSFNVLNQLASANFYFAERHPWEFQSEGLLHIFKQAGVVTPPLYFVFGVTLIYLFKLVKQGDNRAKLFLYFSLTNLIIYFVLAPWTDSNSTSVHWPLSGYFALLVFVPDSLRICYKWISNRWGSESAKKIIFSVPVIGFTGTLIGLVGVGSQAFQTQLQPLVGNDLLSNKMAGWQEFSNYYDQVVSRHFDNDDVIAITDNYYTSAQLEFAGLASQTYNLDNDKAIEDGRASQYSIWQQDKQFLSNDAGEPAIFVTEDSTLTIPDKTDVLELACSYLEDVQFLEQLWLFDGAKRFSFYKVGAIRSGQSDLSQACPYPSQGWLSSPVEGDVLEGEAPFTGWVFNEGVGVEEVNLLINGINASRIDYGISRPDVVEVMEVDSDPNRPNLGFEFVLDTTELENGRINVALELINKVGERQIYGTRTVTIANP